MVQDTQHPDRAACLEQTVRAGQDYEKLAIQPVNQATFLIDAARPQVAVVQASRSIDGIGRTRIDQPMRVELPTPGLLQRLLQMGRIGR